MNIKETLKYMWYGTKMLGVVVAVMSLLTLLALSCPWVLAGIGVLWMVWFVGYMLS